MYINFALKKVRYLTKVSFAINWASKHLILGFYKDYGVKSAERKIKITIICKCKN